MSYASRVVDRTNKGDSPDKIAESARSGKAEQGGIADRFAD